MLKHAKAINLKHSRFWLLPQKAMFWQKKKILMLADLHIGKSGHFRKNGIPVPVKVNATNIERMDQLVADIEPEHLIILGDLFHSRANKEWQQFEVWRKGYPRLKVSLVIGNHDVLPGNTYHSSHINLFKLLRIDNFLLIHDLNGLSKKSIKEDTYVLSGHIHPAIQLRGKGRQTMKLPCFYFGQRRGILPAFGKFTGTHVIEPKKGEQIYTIANSQVLTLNTS